MAKKLGNPLPKVNEVPQPSEIEINSLVAKWNANCPPFYVGLLEAQAVGDPNPTARFLYDRVRLQYIHRKTRRILSRREIGQAFIEYYRKVG